MIGKFFQKYWKLALFLFVSLVVILGASFFLSGRSFEGFTNALVAWATLMLAVVAFWSIQKTIEENKRLREEQHHIQERQRRQSMLSEILDWAEDIATCGHTTNMPIADATDDVVMLEQYRRLEQIDSIRCFRRVNTQSERIKEVASFFDEDFRSEIESAAQKLNDLITVRWDFFDFKATEEMLAELEGEAHNSAENLIRRVNKMLLRDIG